MSNNLPIQLTRFVGRQRELDDVKRLLADVRLLTMTGSGGSGKTRLALEVARQVDLKYEGDLFWVDITETRTETSDLKIRIPCQGRVMDGVAALIAFLLA